MYCPKCGQPQVSEEMRFCSRCGFQLGEVTALIASGGLAVTNSTLDAEVQRQLATRRRTRQGAKLMFASGVLLPLCIALSIPFDSPVPLFLPFVVFLAGLAWLLYFRFFGDDLSPAIQQKPPAELGVPNESYLNPARPPAATFVDRSSQRTAEIVQPASVTEHTTRLLDEN